MSQLLTFYREAWREPNAYKTKKFQGLLGSVFLTIFFFQYSKIISNESIYGAICISVYIALIYMLELSIFISFFLVLTNTHTIGLKRYRNIDAAVWKLQLGYRLSDEYLNLEGRKIRSRLVCYQIGWLLQAIIMAFIVLIYRKLNTI